MANWNPLGMPSWTNSVASGRSGLVKTKAKSHFYSPQELGTGCRVLFESQPMIIAIACAWPVALTISGTSRGSRLSMWVFFSLDDALNPLAAIQKFLSKLIVCLTLDRQSTIDGDCQRRTSWQSIQKVNIAVIERSDNGDAPNWRRGLASLQNPLLAIGL